MTPSGIGPATFQFVAQRHNHRATAVGGYNYDFHNQQTSYQNNYINKHSNK